MKMPIEMRWMLAERRAERLYNDSPAKGLSYGPVKLGIADPASSWPECGAGVWVFQFGAYGSTHVLAYGHLEDALEAAAAWLKCHAPGHLTEPDYDAAVAELAEADLTYTESGWLLSYEWTCTELQEPEDLLAYVRRNNAARGALR